MKKFFVAVLIGGGIMTLSFNGVAEAKSVTVSQDISQSFIQRFLGDGRGASNEDYTNDTSVSSGGWSNGMASGANVNVTYEASLYNNATSTLIAEGAAVPIGTVLRVQPKTHSDADISWFGTGYASDSPNGHWSNSAAAPNVACNNADFVGKDESIGISTYVPLLINPPTKTYSATGPVSKVGDNLFEVTGAGAITATVTFSSTYGKFYYRYYDHRDETQCDGDGLSCFTYVPGCYGNNTPMRAGSGTLVYNPKSCNSSGCTGYNDGVIPGSAYQLSVPQKVISFSVTGATGNAAPNAPTITGPTTGSPNTSYTFTFQASDPDNDTLKYGIDWDNNSSVDEWVPASGFVASNTSRTSLHSWPTIGAKTFKALAQDSNGATSAWSAPFTITLANAPAPTLNFTINNSVGPLDVARGSNLNLVWSATNVSSCTGYGAGWASGEVIGTSGNTNIEANASDNYIVNCTGSYGDISSSITVNLVNILKVCQNSCSSGIQRGNTSTTQSFTLAEGGSQNLVACFNSVANCSDATGNVTASATWSENTDSNVVTLSGSNPKTVTGNTSGSENISAAYSGQTANMTVNVACVPSISCATSGQGGSYCENQTYTVDNGCGTILTCNGTKSCDYNWREVAP